MTDETYARDDQPNDKDQRAVVRRELKRRRRLRNRFIVLLVVAGMTTLLGIANRDNVDVEYLFGDAEISLVWVILGAFSAGAAFAWAYSFVRRFGRDDR